MKRIGLVHALHASIEPIESAFAEHWPVVQTVSLFDQSLYLDYSAAGQVTGEIADRIERLLHYSASCGADAILFTGSLFGAPVEESRRSMKIPVLTAYEAMIEKAFEAGERIAVLATVADTAHMLTADVRRYAEQHGRECSVTPHHVPGALDALFGGDRETHDRLIVEAADAALDCDALLLGQFSMAGAYRKITPVTGRTVLTSTETAVGKLKELLS